MAALRKCRGAALLPRFVPLRDRGLRRGGAWRAERVLRSGGPPRLRPRCCLVSPAFGAGRRARRSGIRTAAGPPHERLVLHRSDADAVRSGRIHRRESGRQAARNLPRGGQRGRSGHAPPGRGGTLRLCDGQLCQAARPASRQFADGHDREPGHPLPHGPVCRRGQLHLPPPHREPHAERLRQDRPGLRLADRLRRLLRQARGLRRHGLHEGERDQTALRRVPRRGRTGVVADRVAADAVRRAVVPPTFGLLRQAVAHDGRLHEPRRARPRLRRVARLRRRTSPPHAAGHVRTKQR